MKSLLKKRNGLLLLAGQSISALGNWVLAAALPVWVYQLTGSASALGAMIVFETLPVLLVGPLAGVLVDRWNRQRTLIAGNLLRGLAVLALLLVQTPEQLPVIFAVGFFNALIAAFTSPAQEALLPSLIPSNELVAFNSLLAIASTSAQFIGPMLGSALIVLVGPPATFVVDSVSFLIMALAVAALRLSPVNGETGEEIEAERPILGVYHSLVEGLHFIRRNAILSGILITWSLLMVAAGVVQAALVPFVQDVLNGSDATYGYLLSLQGAGLILGGIVTMMLGDRFPLIRVFQVGLMLFGTVFVLLSVANLVWAKVLMFGVGFAMAVIGVTEMTIFQQETPAPYRGRILALDNFAAALMVLLGAGGAGVLTDILNARVVLGGAAWLTVVAALLAIWLFRTGRIAGLSATSQTNTSFAQPTNN